MKSVKPEVKQESYLFKKWVKSFWKIYVVASFADKKPFARAQESNYEDSNPPPEPNSPDPLIAYMRSYVENQQSIVDSDPL